MYLINVLVKNYKLSQNYFIQKDADLLGRNLQILFRDRD
jgi:hypothetical protein